MQRVPAAVAQAAAQSRLGHLVRRYPSPIGLNVYFGTCAAAFALFILCMGAPWPPVTGFSLVAAAFLVPAVVFRVNRAVYLYDGGLVVTAYDRGIKAAARWDQLRGLNWADRRIFFFFTLVRLRWTEYTMTVDGRPIDFSTEFREDAHALAYVVTDHFK